MDSGTIRVTLPGEFNSQEEAITAALEDAPPGTVITIHQPGCSTRVDYPCDCRPLTFTVMDGSVN